MLPELSNSIGSDLRDIATSLHAWDAKAQNQGYSTKLLVITFRNLPRLLSQNGKYQEKSTIKAHSNGLMAEVTWHAFSCDDTLDDGAKVVSTACHKLSSCNKTVQIPNTLHNSSPLSCCSNTLYVNIGESSKLACADEGTH